MHNWKQDVRWFVLGLPMGILAMVTVWSLIDLESFFAVARQLTDLILQYFSKPIVWTVFGAFCLCLAGLFLPISRHKIGGPDAQKLLAPFAWFSITLCTTIAVGILFWAMSEPIFHLQDPGGNPAIIAPFSPGAEQFALSSLYMHWAFSPYAIYTICGVAFAIAATPNPQGFGMRIPIERVFGERTPGALIAFADTSVLLALLLGMAASFGVGVLLLSGGLASTFSVANTSVTTAVIALFLALTISASSVSGVLKGIRYFSIVNTVFFVVMLLIIASLGPMQGFFASTSAALGDYFTSFVPRALMLDDFPTATWRNDWTVFYFTNWFAWAPVTAIFLASISRGYTVRAFITMNLILPSLFSLVWMSVIGVFTLNVNRALENGLQDILTNNSPEAVMFAALATLPGADVFISVMLVIAFLSFVTAADSSADAIAKVCTRSGAQGATAQSVIKIVSVCTLAFLGWMMITFSGIDGVRMLSNVGGLPGMILVWVMMAYVIKQMMRKQSPLAA